MPKVSIIVPVYNVEKYLKRCVDSILAQTFTDFELILVDDGSTDESGDICDKLKQLDNRILVVHKVNKGVSAARNTGIDMATGEFIMFVDSDDYIDAVMLEKMLEYIGADCIVSGLRFVDTFQRNIKECNEVPFCNVKIKDFIHKYYKEMDDKLLLSGPYNKLYKKKIVDVNKLRFNTNISICEDGLFVAEYLDKCQTISNIDKCYYNYVQYNSNNLMQKYNDNAIEASSMLFNAKMKIAQKIDDNELLYYVEYASLRGMCGFFSQIYSRSGLDNKHKYLAAKKSLCNTDFRRLLKKYKKDNARFFFLYIASKKNGLMIVNILYNINYLKFIRIIKKIVINIIRR